MSKYNYKHQYISESEYNVIQIRDDKNRTVSKDKPDYLLFLQEGNTPEEILYVAPTNIEQTIDELKISKISMLKDQTRNTILEKYPDYKQRSAALGVYGDDIKQTITNYIITKKAECDLIENQIINAKTIDELNLINISITQ